MDVVASASLLRTSFVVTSVFPQCATPTLGEVYSSRVRAAWLFVVMFFTRWWWWCGLVQGCKCGAFIGK